MILSPRTERILTRIGIDPAADSPHVRQLAHWIERSGVDTMGVTWGPEAVSDDAKARALLEVQWNLDHGHAYQTEVLDDYPINRRYDVRKGTFCYEVRLRRVMPWLRDQGRRLAMHARILRDRVLGRRNPFEERA